MTDSIHEGVGTKEHLDALLKRVKQPDTNNINEGIPFEERLKQNISYRYLWAFEKIEAWRKEQGKKPEELHVIDVGSWTGMMSYLLSRAGYNVTAIDKEEAFLKVIQDHSPNVKIVQEDIMNIPSSLSNNYDIAIALEIIEHLTPDKEVLKSIYNILREQSLLILNTPIERNLICKEHVNFYDFYQLMDLFDTFTNDYKVCKLHKFKKHGEKNNLWGVVAKKGELDGR